MHAILSPSDLSPSHSVQRVGARLVAIDGAPNRQWWLRDAFGDVPMRLARDVAAAAVGVGDFVEVTVRPRGDVWWVESLDAVHPRSHPREGVHQQFARAHAAFHVSRARLLHQVRAFFRERAYLEVETPCLAVSPGLDLHLDAFAVPGAGFLITSPEYDMKRLLAAGYPRIFQLARCFRRGETGPHHRREFTMLEWYRAFYSVEQLMVETEDLVRAVVTFAHPSGVLFADSPHPCNVRPPFVRMTVAEAFGRWAPHVPYPAAVQDDDVFFRTLVERVEPGLGRLGRPVFLHDYPARHASLARLRPDAPEVAERFELYLGGLELCNGFGELTDPREQRARLERDQEARRQGGLPVYPLDEGFIDALTEGMPPAAGNALGIDRLCLLVNQSASLTPLSVD
ncbi:MAG: EF-P lysine aminoacylase EpmA [Myxococcota bacterium]